MDSYIQNGRSQKGANIQHPFLSIIFIIVSAVISGFKHWEDIEDYASANEDWFQSFLDLPNGIPSHDTFRRLFCLLDFEFFSKAFMDWVQEVQEHLKVEGDQIAIDGKTLRGSFCKTKFVKALHTVNAFSTSTSMSLGQLNTQKKSNEITTIPFLLDLLKLKGNLVSIDAIGCQKKIAEKIVEKGGDYLLALKKNTKHQHAL